MKKTLLSILLFASTTGLLTGCAGGRGVVIKTTAELEAVEPTDAITFYNDGVRYLNAGKWSRAEKRFLQAIEEDWAMPTAHSNLGYVMQKQGSDRFEEAITHLGYAINMDSTLEEAYAYRGALHAALEDKDSALADYRKLSALNPALAEGLWQVMEAVENQDVPVEETEEDLNLILLK